MKFHMNKTGSSPHGSFPTDRPKADPSLQFFFVCALVVSSVGFVLSLFVLHLSFIWYLGKAIALLLWPFLGIFTYILLLIIV